MGGFLDSVADGGLWGGGGAAGGGFWREGGCGGSGRLGIEGDKRKVAVVDEYERDCTLYVGDCVMIFRGWDFDTEVAASRIRYNSDS